MEFKIETTIKRVYHIEYVRYDCSSEFGAVFTVKCEGKQAHFEIGYYRLFKELEDNVFSGIKDIEKLNLSDMVNYLIERQNRYILDKIVLALNNNECELLRLDAYADWNDMFILLLLIEPILYLLYPIYFIGLIIMLCRALK